MVYKRLADPSSHTSFWYLPSKLWFSDAIAAICIDSNAFSIWIAIYVAVIATTKFTGL